MIKREDANDVLRHLSCHSKVIFRSCKLARCACGAAKEDCRERWEKWEDVLRDAEAKINALRYKDDEF